MRIKRLTIGNFKNLAETTLDLTRMIALVSPNNYGKSNLLEAVRFAFDFISASAKERNVMMRWNKGIPLSSKLAGKDFIFNIEFENPEYEDYRFIKYGFKFSWYNDQETGAIITDETIEMRPSESVRYTAYLKRDKGKYRAGKSKTGFRNIALSNDVLAIDVLSSFNDIEIAQVIYDIKNLGYRMCNTLELDDSFRPSPIEFEFDAKSSLSFDDNDIPRALSILSKEKPEQFDLFVETIYELFPEFSNVELSSYTLKGKTPAFRAYVVSSSDNSDDNENEKTEELPYHVKDEIYRLIIQSKHLNQPISMEHMSTGTKRIFWLVANAVFGGSYNASLLGVDEIETSIHPRMIRSLLEALCDILENTSMLITSHSPYLIQYLKPEAIYVGVPNNDGVATFKKINPTKIKSLISLTRDLETSVGEYLFELMSGDDDSATILSAYLEGSCDE
jgi:predicted ATPase